MPTGLLHTTNSFEQEDVIHASEAGLFSPRALTLDPAKFTANANAKKILRAGSIIYKIAGATMHRAGIRTKLDAAITASSTTVLDLVQQGAIHKSETAGYFVAGDVLKVLRPYGSITLADTWAGSDTATATVDGHAVTFTAAGATLADIATGLAAAINADPILSKLVVAIADGAVVYIFSLSLKPYSLAAAETTAGDGTATASGTDLTGNVTIGTIASNGVDVPNGQVTLAAAAAISLPSGAPIGIEGTPWGLTMGAFDIGKADNDVTGFTGGPVYGDRLVYWDDDIAAALPQITFV